MVQFPNPCGYISDCLLNRKNELSLLKCSKTTHRLWKRQKLLLRRNHTTVVSKRCHPCFEEGKLREWRQSSKWTQSVKLLLSLLNQTKSFHEFTVCVDKQRDILTFDFKLAEVPWSAKFKSARTRPLLVSKKSFRFPRRKRHESWSAISSLRFRGKPDHFLRTQKPY